MAARITVVQNTGVVRVAPAPRVRKSRRLIRSMDMVMENGFSIYGCFAEHQLIHGSYFRQRFCRDWFFGFATLAIYLGTNHRADQFQSTHQLREERRQSGNHPETGFEHIHLPDLPTKNTCSRGRSAPPVVELLA